MTAALFKRHEQLNAEDWRRLSDLVQEFEAAWRQTFGPALEDFVPAGDDSLRMRSLIELVRIDQEFRWERDQRRLLEEYLTQWPELSQSPDALLELLLAECLTRASFGVPATQPELQSRFPELAARINLDQVAALAQSEKAQASTDQKYDSPTLLKPNEPAQASLPETEDWSVVRSSRRLGKLTGKRLGRYELRRVLGNGGMGTVYEAWDTELTRAVALKMPRPELLSDPTVLQRFMTEARSAAAIRHPNVCSTYDVGQIDGQYFLTMPLIDGVSLAAWLEQHATSATEAAQIIRKLASALQAVHDLGTRHRDIKASNVMIDRKGEPILMDFGLARLNDSATHVTDTGSMLGTPAYMAPEQIEEGAAGGDHRADIYSLGVLFYQMLTGRLPFVGPVTKVLVQIATQTPPSIASLCPDIDSTLAEICHRAMARDPASRYQSVTDLETALQIWLDQRSRHAPRDEPNVSTLPTTSTTPNNQTTSTARSAPHAEREGYVEPPRRNRKATALISAAAFFVLAAAIVIKISDRAELVITSPEPGLEVKIVQLAQPEQERTLTFGKNSVRVRSGQVEVVLTGANADEYEVVGDKITLKRFGREVVEIKRRQLAVAKTPSRDGTGWHGWSADAPPPAIAPFDSEQAKQHQETWAKYLDVPVEHTNSIGMKFRLIPPGEFLMGSTQGEIDEVLKLISPDNKEWQEMVKSEVPRHQVILTRPIYLGMYEVTQREYEMLMGKHQSHFAPMGDGKDVIADRDTSNHPVERVSWNDAAEFCAKLSEKEKLKPFYFRASATVTFLDGTGYRLPKEAEWEFACRAGTTAMFWSGDKDDDLRRVGWFGGNSGERTHAVGELKANPFGLHDLLGNVWEMCQDLYEPTHDAEFGKQPTIDPAGPSSGIQRVFRGGYWSNHIFDCRASSRLPHTPDARSGAMGFRAVLSVDAVKRTEPLGPKVAPIAGNGWHGWPTDASRPAIAPFNAEQAKKHQQAWADYLNVPVEYTNSIGMKFRLIPPGELLMGSTQREVDETISRLIPEDKTGPAFCRSESPQHKVVLTQPFYVGIYEVTQQEYETVLGTNPSQFSANGPRKDAVAGMDTGKHPVELVQWRDAADFCAKLSAKEKLRPCYFKNGLEVTVLEGRNGYRFPTEAQWEFACRAGTTTKYWNGDTDEGLVQIGWFNRNSGDRTHAVGELNANPFGLYDVHGNVREYCQDWFDEEFYKTFQDKEAIDPLFTTRTSTSDHLVRGGGSQNNPTICRSASRHTAGGVAPGHVHTGFRVVLSVDAVRQTLASGNLLADLDREVAWWVLAGGGHGEIKADVEGVNSTFDATEQLPNKPFAITDLYIHRKTVKAQDLEKLTGLSRLTHLRYVEVKIGDNLTRHIEGLTNVTYLQLNQCGLTDVGVERLGKLSKLEFLDLNWQPGITDRGLAVVQQMPRLGTLNLMSTSVTDKGLTYLRQLPIAGLFMTGTKVTDAGMTTLAEVRSLEQLDLSVTSIGDEGVAQLASLPKLRMLALQKTALTDQGLKHLATVRSLQTLHVGGTKVTADGIASLRKALPNCKITDEPLPSEPPKPTTTEFAQWIKQVASRSADGQLVEVVKKLRELNPEFDGNFSHKVEKGAVTELLITNAHIVDISPLRALPELKTLRLAGSTSPNPNQIGQLVDLSPLVGMKLTSLDCRFTRVKDLSPLTGMKLTQLNCEGTKVDDLSPLAQMPLTDLNCGSTGISDLSPLKGMPLTKLNINSTHKITDLTALKGLPLTELVLFHNVRLTDLSPLEGMKLTVLDCFTTGVTDLSPLQGMPLTFLQCANTKVSDLSPLEGMPLMVLYCFSTQVEDLSPLKGMPLKSLLCNRTRVNDATLKHLSGLSELEKLDLADTKVSAAGIATLQKALPNCKITVELSPADRPKPTVVATVPAASPWDLLDAAQIPATERVPEQPKELVAVLGEHRQRHAHSAVSGIAVRPDGKRFVTIGRDGMRFWDADTFQELGRVGLAERKNTLNYSSAAYISQGRKLVVGSEWSLGVVWHLDDSGLKMKSYETLPAGNSERMSGVSFIVSPDERWMIRRKDYFGKTHLSLISLADGKYRIVAEYPDYQGADFSPDSRSLAICHGKDKTIHILELGTGEPVERHVLKTYTEATADQPALGFVHLAYVSDGRLATADNNGRTWFWNLQKDPGKPEFSAKGSNPQYPLHAARQAPVVECAGMVWSVDATQAKVKLQTLWGGYAHGESARPESNLTAFALLPDGKTVVTGHLNGSVRFWDLSGEVLAERNPPVVQPLASPYVHLVQLPGVIATRDEQNHLRLWQPTTKGLIEHSASQSDDLVKCLPLTASDDGKLLVTGSTGGSGCVIWNWDGEHLTPHLRVGRYGTRSAALSSDGRRLAIGHHHEEGVDVWDITARPPRLERALPPPNNKTGGDQVMFVRGGSLLITKMGPTHTIWDLAEEQPVARPLLSNQATNSPLAFTSTRNLFATAANGTQLLSFEKSPPEPLFSLPLNLNEFGSATFSHDGKLLAVTDYRFADQTFLDVYNTETGLRQNRIPLLFSTRQMAFTADNRHLITANSNGTIYVLRLEPAPAKPSSK